LHRRSTFQPRLSIDLRLASVIHLRLCLPTQPPTLIDCQILRLAFKLTSNLRWRPTFRPAFQPTFDLRLRPTFRPSLCTDPRLAPPADPRPAFQLTSSLRLRSIFRLNLPADFQLAPSFNLPVPPSNLTSDSHRPLNPFGAAFRLTCGLRHGPTFQPCLTDQRSDTGCRISGSASRPISDSRLRPTFPPGLRIQPPSPRLRHPVGAADRLTCGFHRRSTVRPCLTDQQPIPRCRISGATSGQSLTRVSDQPSAAFRFISNLRWRPTFRLNFPVDLRLSPLINLLASFGSYLWLSPRSILRLSSDPVVGFRLQPIFQFRL